MRICLAMALAGMAAGLDGVPVQAEPMPRPAADYAATAKTTGDGPDLKLAHADGRVRLDMTLPSVGASVTGLVDTKRGRMVMMIPGMDRMAVEIELPEAFSFARLPPEGTRLGTDTVAGEACDLWRTAGKVGSDPVEACITADGIVLRANATVNGSPRRVFEVLELTRGPQDPALFEVPKGVKVTKVPKGMESMVPGLDLGFGN